MERGADISAIRYSVMLATEQGAAYLLNNAVLSMAWEEQEGQLAQKATITVEAGCEAGGESILEILKLNRIVQILANWGEGEQKVFEGMLWEWNYSHGQQKTLSITAYDPMIRLQQSKDFKFFCAGLDSRAIIENICADWGVPVDYKWTKSIAHEKKVFHSNAISDMILEILDEVKQQTQCPYVILYREGKLEINSYGTNETVYLFGETETSGTTDKLSMDNLVTRVKVMGKADDEGRSGVEAVIDGNLDFGVLQEIVQRDSDKDIGKAQREAAYILQERGKPEENIMATAPDLPFLRKGDAVEMKAGNLIGTFFIKGISHNGTARQMTMTLMRPTEAPATGA